MGFGQIQVIKTYVKDGDSFYDSNVGILKILTSLVVQFSSDFSII